MLLTTSIALGTFNLKGYTNRNLTYLFPRVLKFVNLRLLVLLGGISIANP